MTNETERYSSLSRVQVCQPMQNQPHDPMARFLNWTAFPADSSRSFPTVFVMECECCQLLAAPRSDSTAQHSTSRQTTCSQTTCRQFRGDTRAIFMGQVTRNYADRMSCSSTVLTQVTQRSHCNDTVSTSSETAASNRLIVSAKSRS